MKRNIFLTAIIFLLAALCTYAQKFTASIEEAGSYYRLTFTVTSSDASGFTPPSLDAFDILSGPSTSTFSSYQIVNGRTSHTETTSYTYILSAKKNGKITIGQASVRANGHTLRSNALSLNAHEGGAGGGRKATHSQGHADDADDIAGERLQQAGSAVTNRDLFIDVTPSRTKVREQEAVLLTYRIHSRVGVGLANTQLNTKPDFKGLISQEIPIPGNQIQTTIEHRNGTTYRTGTILQYVVFPQQSGRIEIPSITFDCTVVQQDNTMDLADAFFNGGGSIGVQVKRTVPVTTLQVEPLPQPKPADFSGAVGKFTIQGKVINGEIKTNDIATYRITLNGLGNMKLITPPKVAFPTDFDTYDAKTNDDSRVTANGLTGQLTFDYTFVPRNVGKYTIPATSFVFFDTESGTYKTISTQPITLDVKKGKRSNADVDAQLALLRSDIRDIHPVSHDNAMLSSFTWGTLAFWMLHILLVAAFVVLIYWGSHYVRSHADVATRRKSGAGKQAVKRLREAEKLLSAQDASLFYAAVSKALAGFLSDKYGIEQSDMSREIIARLLTEKGVAAGDVEVFLNVMETCQFAQYAPGADSQRNEVYRQALKAIESLQK